MSQNHLLYRLTFISALCLLLIIPLSAQSHPLTPVIDKYLRQFSADYFSGAVLIVQNGDVILNDAYGMADEITPFTSETVVDAGSISKQFTAAAVMHLQSTRAA
ncbi:MAG: serine hydrolase [Nostocaceae cyanobacterium CSU_2_110]|nr:serine hydrolase [Nostocaceae cyanobacterium CSU_2_110]